MTNLKKEQGTPDSTERLRSRSKARSTASSRARSVAFVGLAIALIAVSAWIVVPIGPVPFTMQMFSITLIICLLTPAQAIAAIFGYVALGAIGVPVFSGMRGGIGIILGPTGGFLLGYLIAVPAAVAFLWLATRSISSKKTVMALEVAAGIIFTAISYSTGIVQYSFVANVDFVPAFLTSVAPFIIPDLAKIVLAVVCAQPIKSAVPAMAVLRR